MDNVQYVTNLLEKHWAPECDLVGPSNVRDIAEGEIEIESAEEGHFLDLVATLTLLSIAATFIKESIEIYRILREELGRKPKYDELKDRKSSNEHEPSQVDEEKREEIYHDICGEFDNPEE